MQSLTTPPRQDIPKAVVQDLLVGQGVRRGFGLELLDASNRVIEDISADCKGFEISHDNGAEVHGKIATTLARELPWGQSRVRAYRTLSKNGITARFNRGAFVLTMPDIERGRRPLLYKVTGQDLTYLLDRYLDETYELPADGTTTYMQALRSIFTAAGITVPVLLDGTRQDTVIPATRVWAITTSPRWLDVVNDLLQEISYTDIHNDENGAFRAAPVAPVESRPVEWRFDVTDKLTDLIGADRTETQDLWAAPNVWRFVAAKWPRTPTEGDGLYTVVNQSSGLSSIDSVGRRPKPLETIDVADHAALVSEGNRIVASDQRAERVLQFPVALLPIAGHMDVIELVDGGAVSKVLVSSWSESQEGLNQWTAGAITAGVRPRTETQTTGTVTSASPLRVVVDGATADSAANSLNGVAYQVGDRVSTLVRNPDQPLVQGVES